MLHLVFQSPVELAVFERMDSGDVIVFLDNAVFLILNMSSIKASLVKLQSNNRLCVLASDLTVRGISKAELIDGLEIISYAGLVELTVNHSVIQSWI